MAVLLRLGTAAVFRTGDGGCLRLHGHAVAHRHGDTDSLRKGHKTARSVLCGFAARLRTPLADGGDGACHRGGGRQHHRCRDIHALGSDAAAAALGIPLLPLAGETGILFTRFIHAQDKFLFSVGPCASERPLSFLASAGRGGYIPFYALSGLFALEVWKMWHFVRF